MRTVRATDAVGTPTRVTTDENRAVTSTQPMYSVRHLRRYLKSILGFEPQSTYALHRSVFDFVDRKLGFVQTPSERRTGVVAELTA